MATNEFVLVPYLEQARERVTEQFKDAPVFDKYLQLLIGDSLELQTVLKDLMEKRSIDTAVGRQLDIIGDIVGQPRELIDADLLEFFGFEGHWNAGPFGTITDTEVGAVFWDGNSKMTGNIVLNDDIYRIFIRAKIAKNTTRATPEEIMRFVNFIFGTHSSTIEDEGRAAYRLMIGRALTRQEIGLLRHVNRSMTHEGRLLPKPTGVRVNYGSFNADAVFAFQGVLNAEGFGDLVFTSFYDGTNRYDGSVVPSTQVAADGSGEPIGGYLATLHGDI